MPPPASPTGARFFHVRIGGFDTHTNQGALAGPAGRPARAVSKAIKAFYDDMVALGVANKVLMMTFSEFGRPRRRERRAGQRRHRPRRAAPLFVVGNPVIAAPGGGHVFGRVPALDAGSLDGGRNLHVAHGLQAGVRDDHRPVAERQLGVGPRQRYTHVPFSRMTRLLIAFSASRRRRSRSRAAAARR
jgi:uncharacterized protein (DUF1501 family)